MRQSAQAANMAADYATAGEEVRNPWFAVRVKSNFEKTAAHSLGSRDFEHFVPTYRETRRWSDRTKVSEFPLFPGYLFCRLNPEKRTPVLATPGVIGIVSSGTQLLPVSEEEIEAVRRAVLSGTPVTPAPWLSPGSRVRVTMGALTGIEGTITEQNGSCRLVLQISLLQRSVSLQIDRHAVEPVKAGQAAK